MTTTVVDRLRGEFSDLLRVLDDASEISLRSTVDDTFRKFLLLSAASYFEHRMTDAVVTFVNEVTNGHPLVKSFVQNKTVSRQYYTWFQWDQKNANSFFGLFGNDFLDFMEQKVRIDHNLADGIRAFLELGGDRNRLVHQDFGSFSMEKTSEEIYALYCEAMKFVEAFPLALREFSACPNREG